MPNCSNVAYVRQWVAVQDDQIGELSRTDRSNAVHLAECVGSISRGRGESVGRIQTRRDEILQFSVKLASKRPSGRRVAASKDPYARAVEKRHPSVGKPQMCRARCFDAVP